MIAARVKAPAIGALLGAAVWVSSLYLRRGFSTLDHVPRGWLTLTAVALAVAAGITVIVHDALAHQRTVARVGLCVSLVVLVGAVVVGGLRAGASPMLWSGFVPYGVAVVLFGCVARARIELQWVAWPAAAVAVVLAATVILDSFGAWPSSAHRPGGLLYNRNFAGEYLALSLPCSLAVLTRRKLRAGLVLIGWALLLSRCRTAWVASLLVVGTLALAQRRGSWVRSLPWVLVGITAGALVPNRLQWAEASPYASTAGRMLDVEHGSGALRRAQYAETWAALAGRLSSGVGPGNWRAALGPEAAGISRNRIPHSDYLRVFSDGGLPALVGFLGVLACAAALAWRTRAQQPHALAFVIALAAVSCANAPLYRPETATLSFCLLAALCAARQRLGTTPV